MLHPSDLEQRTQHHGHLPHHICFNLYILSFGLKQADGFLFVIDIGVYRFMGLVTSLR